MMEYSARPRISFCTPAYNEESGIEEVMRYWHEVIRRDGIDAEIVVTNDGSSDQTPVILQRLQSELGNLVLVDNKENGGYGKALSDAIQNSRGEYVVSLDSDGQFDIAEYALLLRMLENEGHDVVTGYRRRKQDTIGRVIADRALNLIVRVLFRLPLRDTNCALKVYRGDVIRSIGIDSRGYPTPTEILVKLATLGYKIGEEGITHAERASGESKLRIFRTGWCFLWFLFYLKLKQILYRKKIINNL